MTLADYAPSASNQHPRLWQIPRRAASSAGDDAIRWAESIGWNPDEGRGFYILDEWQKWCIRGILSEDANARLCAFVCLLLVPRQNGKNVVLEVVELYAFFVLELPYILHSAHLADTSADHMDRIWEAIQSDPDLSHRCRRVTSNGKERIYSCNEWEVDESTGKKRRKPRRSIRFRTRTSKIGRGGSPQMVVLDEALHLTDRQQQALLPSLAAQSSRPDRPILIYASSAPIDPAEAEVLLRIRTSILEGSMPGAFFAEWSASIEEALAAGIDWDEALRRLIADQDNWVAANPGMPKWIDPEWIDETERGMMSPLAFAIERLGLVLGAGSIDKGPMPRWDTLADRDSAIVSNRAWALAVSPVELGPQWASIGVAGKRADGRLHVQWIERREGTAWVIGRAAALVADGTVPANLPLRVRRTAPEGALIAGLVAAGVKVAEVSSVDEQQSTGVLIAAANGTPDAEGIVTPGVHHLGQSELSEAARGVVLRAGEDGAVVFSPRRSSVEITALRAVAVAVGGVTEPEPVEPEPAESYSF